jgi:glucose/arabinose dehydrogenase
VSDAGGAANSAGSEGRAAGPLVTADRVSFDVRPIATGFHDVTDVATLADGRLLIAERPGTINVFEVAGGRAAVRPVLTLDDVEASRGGGLLAMAPDPDFAHNGLLYIVYTTAADGFRVARLHETDGFFRERAVLLDGVASGVRSAALRFGPDGKLYAAFDDGGDARRAGDLGSYNGKVLRLNADGSTPADQAGASPIYAPDFSAPVGLAWTSTNVLWVGEAAGRRSPAGELRGVTPDAARTGTRRGAIARRYLLPQGSQPAQMTAYQHDRVPAFHGNLLVAGGERSGLLRVRLDAADPLKVVATERLFPTPGAVRAVAVEADGTIVLSTDDTLVRLVPRVP